MSLPRPGVSSSLSLSGATNSSHSPISQHSFCLLPSGRDLCGLTSAFDNWVDDFNTNNYYCDHVGNFLSYTNSKGGVFENNNSHEQQFRNLQQENWNNNNWDSDYKSVNELKNLSSLSPTEQSEYLGMAKKINYDNNFLFSNCNDGKTFNIHDNNYANYNNTFTNNLSFNNVNKNNSPVNVTYPNKGTISINNDKNFNNDNISANNSSNQNHNLLKDEIIYSTINKETNLNGNENLLRKSSSAFVKYSKPSSSLQLLPLINTPMKEANASKQNFSKKSPQKIIDDGTMPNIILRQKFAKTNFQVNQSCYGKTTMAPLAKCEDLEEDDDIISEKSPKKFENRMSQILEDLQIEAHSLRHLKLK